MLDIIEIFKRELFRDIPLPKEYQNPDSIIKLMQSPRDLSFRIFVVNPTSPPLELNLKTKEWEILKQGISNEWE